MNITTRIAEAFRSFRAPQTTAPPPSERKDMGSLAFPSTSLMYSMGLFPSNTGSPVSSVAALQSATVYAAVKRLAEDISKLPLCVRKRSSRGGWVDQPEHPLVGLFRTPNGYQTQFELFSTLITSLNLRGNGYLYTERRSDGSVRRLIPLLPERVSLLRGEQGEFYYCVSNPLLLQSSTFFASTEDVVHVRNLSIDGGMLGLSPIACSQDSIGLALAAQKHGALFFRQGTALSGTLETPSRLSKEAAERIAQSWQSNYSGNDAHHRVAVLEEGLTFNAISISPEDSQMIESMRWSAEEICRIFGVPPWVVGVPVPTGTYSNVEQSQTSYVSNTLSSMAAKIERELERVLLFEDERGQLKLQFDFDTLLRGDLKSRMESYQIGLLNGIWSIDEVREKEGLEALPDGAGAEHRVPLNTSSSASPPSDTSPEGAAGQAPADTPAKEAA